MGWLIGFAILWFVIGRHRRRMWRRHMRMGFVHSGAPLHVRHGGWGLGSPWASPSRTHALDAAPPHFPVGGMRRPASAVAPESAFEALKRRYVIGEMSDEQYEAALDELFRTPEGRRQV